MLKFVFVEERDGLSGKVPEIWNRQESQVTRGKVRMNIPIVRILH
jgi:hypothetical protein